VTGDLGDRALPPACARLARASAPRRAVSACAPVGAWGSPEVQGPEGPATRMPARARPDEQPLLPPLQRGVSSRAQEAPVHARWQELQRRGKAYRHVLPTFSRQLQDLEDCGLAPWSPVVRRDAVEGRARLWHAVCKALFARRIMPAAALRHPGRGASAVNPASRIVNHSEEQ
jgi:hypothetical protein